MRNRLWILNTILSNLVNSFIIVYVLANVEELGSFGVLLIMLSSSITALIVSRLILGRAGDYPENAIKVKKWKILLIALMLLFCSIGLILNNIIISVIGFALLIPVILMNIPAARKAIRRFFRR